MQSRKIEELIKSMTLDEKIGMIHGAELFANKGVERLGIPALTTSDGPMGVRIDFEPNQWMSAGNGADFVTYLPSGSAIAATWNRKLAEKCGEVLGEEARGRNKDVILAPGINIKRSPLCGRNFEYMSEDPYLTGEQAVPFIQGIQKQDTAACVKHFAVNSQETERLWVDTEISERALREIYLPAFQKAVQEGNSYSIMGAYNKIREEHCCESSFLLDKILREEWGYDGVVISDWGAVHDTKKAANCSLDLEMSVTDDFDNYCLAEPLKKMIQNGEIAEKKIDEKVGKILTLMERLHMLDGKRKKGCYNTEEHRRIARETAEESVVLLKNEEEILPLQEEKIQKILVIGENAVHVHSNGGGSAEIKALYEITPLMGLKMYAGGNIQIDYTPGYYVEEKAESDINWQEDSLENGGGKTRAEEILDKEACKKREKYLQRAIEMASSVEYDQVIFIGGLNHDYDLEGQDRKDMTLPYEQDRVIFQLLQVCPNMVVVLNGGAPVSMEKWIDSAKAVLWNWYSGMEGGLALAEILFGKVNPSGHLPESFPKTHLDCPAHSIGEFAEKELLHYTEDIYVGYRYYQTRQVPVRFCFGHGLSYTRFSMEDLQVKRDKEEIKISVKVKNIGNQKGKETVQIYVHPVNSAIDRPFQELRAYEKTELLPGEEKTLSFQLTEESFSYYNEEQGRFLVELGEYEIRAGDSCENIMAAAGFMWEKEQ